VSSVSASGKSSGKTIIAIVLAVLAVLLIVAAIIFFIEPAHSLPSFMGQIKAPAKRANETRPLHGIAAVVAGVVCLVAAFFVNRSNKAVADGSRDPVDASAR
jgi:drug/metabolite transporter (DMT)-like permease